MVSFLGATVPLLVQPKQLHWVQPQPNRHNISVNSDEKIKCSCFIGGRLLMLFDHQEK